jgi:hypothetical protein
MTPQINKNKLKSSKMRGKAKHAGPFKSRLMRKQVSLLNDTIVAAKRLRTFAPWNSEAKKQIIQFINMHPCLYCENVCTSKAHQNAICCEEDLENAFRIINESDAETASRLKLLADQKAAKKQEQKVRRTVAAQSLALIAEQRTAKRLLMQDALDNAAAWKTEVSGH